MAEMTRLEGRVAVVTGASSGIGSAIVRELAGAGMKVAAAARRLDRLEALSDAGEVLPVAVDLRDEAQVVHLFERTAAALGAPFALINNAGIGHEAPLADGDTEAWRAMLEVNVLGVCIATREALRRMERGSVIHVSSMSGHRVVGTGGGLYAATKFAVRALTDALRIELKEDGRPIRVGSISPGFVETEFHQHYFGDAEAAARTYSRIKVLEPADVARVCRQMLEAPEHVEIHDVLMRPREQRS